MNLKPGEVDFSDFQSVGGAKDRKLFDQFYYSFTKKITNNRGEVFYGPIVQADTKIDVSNYLGQALLGNLYIGTPPQKVVIAYDTGSDWKSVESDLLFNCN